MPQALEAGVRMRLTAGSSIHVPGLVDIEAGRLEVRGGRIVATSSRRILIDAPDGSVLFVPQPGERVDGRLVSLEADAFLIKLGKGVELARVPRAAIETVEISAGHSSRMGHVLMGLLGGAAVGAGVGALTGTSCKQGEWFCSPGFNAAAFAVLGAPIGAIGGAVMPVERWKRVPELSVRLGVLAARGGAAIGVTVSF
jgi:hypothetical protein